MTARIKNYTSSVPAERSIMKIERMLVEAGATHISRAYEGGEVSGFMFQIRNFVFKLPSNVKPVEDFLMAKVRKPRGETAARVSGQARRTAWRMLEEWVAIQVSMILIKRVEAEEVFLSYAYDFKRDKTLYELIKGGEIWMLDFKGENK